MEFGQQYKGEKRETMNEKMMPCKTLTFMNNSPPTKKDQISDDEEEDDLEEQSESKQSQLMMPLEKEDTKLLRKQTTWSQSLKMKYDEKDQMIKNNILMLGLQNPAMISEKDRKCCMIYPNDKFKILFWDIIISLCLLLTCIFIPFNMAFSEDLESVIWYNVILYIMDVLFLIDIFINFNSAYVIEEVHLVTIRKKIMINYIKSWFLIDFLAVIPFDIIFEYGLVEEVQEDQVQNNQKINNKINQYIRLSKVSKLYKLIKITRLIRLVKLMQKKDQIMRKMKHVMKFGHAIERFFFFIMLIFLMTHFIGCFWIFIGKYIQDFENKNDTWIESGGYEEVDMMEMYTLAIYFTMQTLTTVGYGDFSIQSIAEKIMTIILQLVGIIAFSFIAGAITNMIHDFDEQNQKNQDQLNVLHQLYGIHPMPPDLYYSLLAQIQNVDDKKVFKETNKFLDELPFRLKLMTTKFIYKKQYEQIDYLKVQSENFLVWICPLLKQEFFLTEQYLYQQTDMINDIYFLTGGTAGFVLPLRRNVVYIEINKGDYFGEIDIMFAANTKIMNIERLFMQAIQTQGNQTLERSFTVQALKDCTLLSLSVQNLQRMQKQFNSQFLKLFERADNCLQKSLMQKGITLQSCESRQLTTMERFQKKEKTKILYKKYKIKCNSHGGDSERNSHLNNLMNRNPSSIVYFKDCKLLAQINDVNYEMENSQTAESESSSVFQSIVSESLPSVPQIDSSQQSIESKKTDQGELLQKNTAQFGDQSPGEKITIKPKKKMQKKMSTVEFEFKLKEMMIEQNNIVQEKVQKNQEKIKAKEENQMQLKSIKELNDSDEMSDQDKPNFDQLQKLKNLKRRSSDASIFQSRMVKKLQTQKKIYSGSQIDLKIIVPQGQKSAHNLLKGKFPPRKLVSQDISGSYFKSLKIDTKKESFDHKNYGYLDQSNKISELSDDDSISDDSESESESKSISISGKTDEITINQENTEIKGNGELPYGFKTTNDGKNIHLFSTHSHKNESVVNKSENDQQNESDDSENADDQRN